jgi:hypothetical protein
MKTIMNVVLFSIVQPLQKKIFYFKDCAIEKNATLKKLYKLFLKIILSRIMH